MPSPTQKTADRWNRRLKYFRFHFAHGGHANDGDDLSANIAFPQGVAGLQDVFARLGVPLERIPAAMPRRELGRAYSAADWPNVADPIAAYSEFSAPGFVRIEDMPVYLAVSTGRIRIMVSGAEGDPWVVGEQDFRHALRLELLLPARGIRFVRIASRKQTEKLFHVLQAHRLPDLQTHIAVRGELVTKGAVSPSAPDTLLATYAELRQQLGAEFDDEEVWQDAHGEIHALVQSALHFQANPHYVAYRCPGFAKDVIDRVCADVHFALR